ncbi:polyprenol monophosphomannose synthase [bacterium]|nr:polyprenol monophosphomannose synthase [bacterium]
MNTVIVLPVLNEADNIYDFISQVIKNIDSTSVKIIVVDDYSPDGTADIVRNLQKEYKNLFLIQNNKTGLGNAYKKGFKYAVEELRAEILIEMDSDFSHPPELINNLISEIHNGYDFVIGSRYIKGGSIPDNWGLFRKMNSKYGNIFARFIAGLKNIHDCTSGFRAIRADFIKNIDLDKLDVQGYSFQMNILFECVNMGAKVKEIPLNFKDREKGKSKLGIKDISEFIINSLKLLLRRLFF